MAVPFNNSTQREFNRIVAKGVNPVLNGYVWNQYSSAPSPDPNEAYSYYDTTLSAPGWFDGSAYNYFLGADGSGNVSITGTLGVTGATTLSSTLAVSGNASLTGSNGLFLQRTVALTSTAADIASGAGLLLLLRDNTNGGTALVLYENVTTPKIVSQSGTNFVTAAPTGTQIQLQNRTGNLGVSAKMAAGQSTTLNVGIISVDAS